MGVDLRRILTPYLHRKLARQDVQKLNACRRWAATRRVNLGCKSAPGLDQISVQIDSERFVQSLQDALDGNPVEYITGGQVSERRDFAVLVVAACQRLAVTLGGVPMRGQLSIASRLEEVMQRYGDAEHQGFLLLNDMDTVIEMQRTIEFEGPLRSVMQCSDDVAVVILASNETINHVVGDYDRPFYMSFRVFRI